MITVARHAGSALPQRAVRTASRPSGCLPALRSPVSLPPVAASVARSPTWVRYSERAPNQEPAAALPVVKPALPVVVQPALPVVVKPAPPVLEAAPPKAINSDEHEWAEALRLAKARAVADEEERAWQLTMAQAKARLLVEEEREWAARVALLRSQPSMPWDAMPAVGRRLRPPAPRLAFWP